MGMQRHSPTPWRAIDSIVILSEADHGFSTWLANCQVGGATRPEQCANAAFIVKAVNAHEQLVKALQQIALFDDTSGEVARAALKAADADGG
jgi:hypothetical protein